MEFSTEGAWYLPCFSSMDLGSYPRHISFAFIVRLVVVFSPGSRYLRFFPVVCFLLRCFSSPFGLVSQAPGAARSLKNPNFRRLVMFVPGVFCAHQVLNDSILSASFINFTHARWYIFILSWLSCTFCLLSVAPICYAPFLAGIVAFSCCKSAVIVVCFFL